jgi:hypothetical protein
MLFRRIYIEVYWKQQIFTDPCVPAWMVRDCGAPRVLIYSDSLSRMSGAEVCPE